MPHIQPSKGNAGQICIHEKNNEFNKSFQTPILYTPLSSSLCNSVTINTPVYLEDPMPHIQPSKGNAGQICIHEKNNEFNKSFQTPILYTPLSSSLCNSVTINTPVYLL